MSEIFCSTVKADDGALWGVGITLNRDLQEEDADNLEQAEINIVVTDGSRAWKRDGLTELDMGVVIPNHMRHTLEALVQYNGEPSEDYTVKFTPPQQGGTDNTGASSLLVEVEWDNKRHGKDIMSRIHFDLDAAADPAAEIRRVLGSAVDAAAVLQAEAARLEASSAGLAAEAEAENMTLDEYAARKEELDGDLALKSAAVLAAKQARLAALLREADAEAAAVAAEAEDLMSD